MTPSDAIDPIRSLAPESKPDPPNPGDPRNPAEQSPALISGCPTKGSRFVGRTPRDGGPPEEWVTKVAAAAEALAATPCNEEAPLPRGEDLPRCTVEVWVASECLVE